ncbi:MAG: hypothetical protein HFE78_06055 [Clostridiales bacterium]|nr:hypothetical protein [Clostridiales bacterium]
MHALLVKPAPLNFKAEEVLWYNEANLRLASKVYLFALPSEIVAMPQTINFWYAEKLWYNIRNFIDFLLLIFLWQNESG